MNLAKKISTIVSVIVAAISGLVLIFKASLIFKVMAVVMAVLGFFNAESYGQSKEKVLLIRENFFVTQINDIYLNPKSYLNSMVEFEGIVNKYSYSPTPNEKPVTKYFVFRYGPGCCGPDLYAGFEVAGEIPKLKEGDWVKVVGRIEQYTENKEEYLRVRVSQMAVLAKRGKENVYR